MHLRRLRRDEPLRRRLGEAATAVAARFSLARQIEAYAALLEAVPGTVAV